MNASSGPSRPTSGCISRAKQSYQWGSSRLTSKCVIRITSGCSIRTKQTYQWVYHQGQADLPVGGPADLPVDVSLQPSRFTSACIITTQQAYQCMHHYNPADLPVDVSLQTSRLTSRGIIRTQQTYQWGLSRLTSGCIISTQ